VWFRRRRAIGREVRLDQRRRVVHELQRFVVVGAARVFRAREYDERVRVEVLGRVERHAERVDAIEPSTVVGVLKGVRQRIEQHPRMLEVARLREREQLPRARHGPVALHRRRLMIVGAERFVGQLQRAVEAGPAPHRQHHGREMLAQRARGDGCRSGRKGRAWHDRMGWAQCVEAAFGAAVQVVVQRRNSLPRPGAAAMCGLA